MPAASESGDHAAGLGGVGGAARVQGGERNTRGPSAQPESRQRDSYKSPTKASAAQQASEGIVVAVSRATKNARGAKGPCGSSVDRASTREGMTGKTGSNHPGGHESADKVRQLQRRLWSVAKRHPGRRVHALYDPYCPVVGRETEHYALAATVRRLHGRQHHGVPRRRTRHRRRAAPARNRAARRSRSNLRLRARRGGDVSAGARN
jgi:hypothetical protein